MANARTTFEPSRHGFHFVNRFDVADLFDLKFFDELTKNRPIIYGLCGGMCFAALDYFYQNKPVPEVTQPPEDETRLYKYLRDRQIHSLSLDTLKNVFTWTLQDDLDVAKWTANKEVPQLRASLDQGKPAVLALIRVEKSMPTSNHQVLAIAYDLHEDTNILEIVLYDPNHPDKTPRIFVDLTNPQEGIKPRQSTGEPLRGFFVIDYKPKHPPEKID